MEVSDRLSIEGERKDWKDVFFFNDLILNSMSESLCSRLVINTWRYVSVKKKNKQIPSCSPQQLFDNTFIILFKKDNNVNMMQDNHGGVRPSVY